MKLIKIILILVLLASTSCFQELSTIKTSSRSTGGGSLGTAGALNIAETVVNKMTLALVATYGLKQKQAVTLAHGALELLDKKQNGAGLTLWQRTKLYLNGSSFNGNDITQVAPVIMQGMMAAMTQSDAALGDDASKMNAVRGITTSMFSSIKDNIATLSPEKRKALPGSIAQTAVANLVSGGVSVAKIAESVNTIMNSTVATLNEAGYKTAEIVGVVGVVAQGGIQGLSDLKDGGSISAAQVATMSYNVVNTAISSLDEAGVTDMADIKSIAIDVTSTALTATMAAIAGDADASAIFDNAAQMITSGTMSAMGGIDGMSAEDLQAATQSIISDAMATVYADADTYNISFDSSIAASMSAGVYDGLADAGLSAAQINTFSDNINSGIQDGLAGSNVDATAFTAAADESLMPPPTIDAIADVTIDPSSMKQAIALTGITDGGAGNKELTVTATTDFPDMITNLGVAYTSPGTTGTLYFTLGPTAATAATPAIIYVTVDDGRNTTIAFVVNFNTSTMPLEMYGFNVITSTNMPVPLSNFYGAYGSADGSSLIAVRIDSVPANGSLVLEDYVHETGIPLTAGSVVYLSDISNVFYVPNWNYAGADTFYYSGMNASGLYSNSAMVQVYINYVNQGPVFDFISDITLGSYQSNVVVTITGIIDPKALPITLTAVSTNHAVIPDPVVSYTSPNTTATLTLSPINGQGGQAAVIIVTADDGLGGITTQPFLVILDDSSPIITLSTTAPSVTNISPIPVTLNASKPIQPITSSVISTVGAITNFTQISSTMYTFDVTPSASGNIWIMVIGGTVKDLAGHTAGTGTSLNILYDGDNPNVSNGYLWYVAGYRQIPFIYTPATDGGTPSMNLYYALYTSGTQSSLNTYTDAINLATLGEGNVGTNRLTATNLMPGGTYYANVFVMDYMNNVSAYTPSSAIITLSLQQNLTSLAVGSSHACGVTAMGQSYCWGDNTYGQYGIGNTAVSYQPQTYTQNGSFQPYQFLSVVAGAYFSCGLQQDGTVYCWGDNSHGVIGNGVTTTLPDATPYYNPVAIVSTHKFVKLAAGTQHACGIDSSGVIYCWGGNSSGQLGDGTQETGLTTPVAVSGGGVYSDVTAGGLHTCGILATTGSAQCWGENSSGQLGTGNNTPESVPYAVVDTFHYKTLSAGGIHTCGLTVTGDIRCWGGNAKGQLGNSGTGNSNVSTPVSTTMKFISLTTGLNHTCAVADDGEVVCWGDNSAGQLGDGDTTLAAVNSTPQAVANGGKYIKATSGPSANFTCLQAENSISQCVGDNSAGQLATSSTMTQISPSYFNTSIPPSVNPLFVQISSGEFHSCGITAEGRAYCWGHNALGQLGIGTSNAYVMNPVPVTAPENFTKISAGSYHTCALTTQGHLLCWGDDSNGSLGNNSYPDSSSVPVLVPMQSSRPWIDVATGNSNTCALNSSGTTYCWGPNTTLGTVGNGTFGGYMYEPTLVSGGLNFKSIKMGRGGHACGLTYDGTAYCWGNNSVGQLGNNTMANQPAPAMISGIHFLDLTLGTSHTCGLDTNYQVFCWGDNSYGQLANATAAPYLITPMPLTGFVFKKISAGSNHTCGIDASGSLSCWGSDSNYQIGDGTCCNSINVVASIATPSPLKDIAAGGYHTCGLDSFGTPICWGLNSYGQLGTSSLSTLMTPINFSFDASQM